MADYFVDSNGNHLEKEIPYRLKGKFVKLIQLNNLTDENAGFLRVQYENGSTEFFVGRCISSFSKRLIPMSPREVHEEIKAHKRKLSLLESCFTKQT